MILINYRLSDRYQAPILSIAILTDRDPDRRPLNWEEKIATAKVVEDIIA